MGGNRHAGVRPPPFPGHPTYPRGGLARPPGMSYLPTPAVAERAISTPVVSSVVTSLGADSRRPRAVRPWTHAEYTRWRRAGVLALPLALLVGLLLGAAGRQGAHLPGGTLGILAQSAVCWLATAWMIARRR